MKKIFLPLIIIIFTLTGCSANITQPYNKQNNSTVTENSYVKSVWIAYYELQNMICDTEEDFYNKFTSVTKELKEMGFNTITVQVRPCADAFYKSNYFPSSKYCFGKQGSEMKYDPLKVMCTVAKENSMNIEAWINPYRVNQEKSIKTLSSDNIAGKWYRDESTKSYIYVCDNGVYFNPAVKEVTDLIVNGVKEIVSNYEISAIHFDDYFYPTTSKEIDETEYKKYCDDGGKLTLSNWRRENINQMISSVYKAIKETNSKVRFGISPASNIDNDYSKLYADVELWSTEEGYVDYICPQIYFGFKNQYQPFMFTAKKWVSLVKCDLYIGLPLYKAGKKDENASANEESRINEFINNSDIISRQIKYISKIEEIKGFYIFSYDYLFEESSKKEVENMLSVMQSSNPD